MTQPEIANAFRDAQKIVSTARAANIDLNPVWQKLFRVSEYLNKSAAAMLKPTLSDEGTCIECGREAITPTSQLCGAITCSEAYRAMRRKQAVA